MGPVLVRGRDFTAYRIGGAIAAVLLAIVLAWQIVELFDGDGVTVPESRWSTAVVGGEPTGETAASGGALAGEILTARTRLQDERFRSGPAPDEEVPEAALGQGEFLVETPMERDETYPETWATPGDETLAMLRGRDEVIGISSLPYVNADLFERPAARDWRLGIAEVVSHIGAIAIVGFSLLLALVLAIRGRVPVAEGRSGRTVKRFGFVERANHWMTALSFIGLALTGIVIAYGETLILPFGDATLGTAGWIATWGHMMFAPPFFLGILVMAALWLRGNLPNRLDLAWLARGGGFFSDSPDNPPARRFNAGQKLIFWAATLGDLAMVATGVTLMFPYYWLDLNWMSWVMVVHALVGLLLIAIFIGHIYIGTVGMQDAFSAMWSGDVDWNWAAEHHDLWLAEIAGSSEPLPPASPVRGRRPAPGSAVEV